MKKYFASHGYQVDCAAEAEEAKALLAHVRYRIVITDLQLSPQGTEGLSIAAEVHRRSPGTRIILLTGSPSEEVGAAARCLGVDAMLEKPKPLNQLEKIIRALEGDAVK